MPARFLVLMAAGKESGTHRHHTMHGAAVARMLDLRTLLALVEQGFETRSGAQEERV